MAEGHIKGEVANVTCLEYGHLQLLLPPLTQVRNPADEVKCVTAARVYSEKFNGMAYNVSLR